MAEIVGVAGDDTGYSDAVCDLFRAYSRLDFSIIKKGCFKVLFILHAS